MTRKKNRTDENQIGDEFIVTLASDVIASFERHKADPTQQNSRDLIRTIFAAIEGMVWVYRDHVVEIARDLERISFEQEAALAEVGFQVTGTGKITKQARFVPLPALFRLVTRIASSLDPALQVRFDTGEWERFLATIAIRNRVTHPKSQADLNISSDDLEISLEAFFWLCDAIVKAMASANSAFADKARLMSELLEALQSGDPEALALYHAASESQWD